MFDRNARHCRVTAGMIALLSFLLAVSALSGTCRATGGSEFIRVRVDWQNVDESMIPDELSITFIPDGLPWMASNILFSKNSSWDGTLEIIPGTRSLVMHHADVAGLENRLAGDMENGYVLTYYRQGEAPAEEATESVPPAAAGSPNAANYQIAATSLVSRTEAVGHAAALAEDRIAAEMEARGYQEPNRRLYLIGIAVCAVLIVLVILLRIILGRR